MGRRHPLPHLTDETELGLYYLNYHDRSPLPTINAFNAGRGILTVPISYSQQIKGRTLVRRRRRRGGQALQRRAPPSPSAATCQLGVNYLGFLGDADRGAEDQPLC
jgi:hypothetical protein